VGDKCVTQGENDNCKAERGTRTAAGVYANIKKTRKGVGGKKGKEKRHKKYQNLGNWGGGVGGGV